MLIYNTFVEETFRAAGTVYSEIFYFFVVFCVNLDLFINYMIL